MEGDSVVNGPAHTILSERGLLEGPVYRHDGLVFADATFGGVSVLPPTGSARVIAPHRTGIGGVGLHSNGGVVVSGRNVALKMPTAADGTSLTSVLVDQDADAGVVGFNDLTVDRHGRVYVGWLGYHTSRELCPKPGGLLCIDLDGSVRTVAGDLFVPNGLAFSPDGSCLYAADSLRRAVYRYDVAGDGSLGERQLFARTVRGIPDGLTVAEDGSLFVAVVHQGAVMVFGSDGQCRQVFELPVKVVTSLALGGDDRRDLYVVTGPSGDGEVQDGRVYRLRSSVPGIAANQARVEIAAGSGRPPGQRRGADPTIPLRDASCPRCGSRLKIDGPHDLGVLSEVAPVIICARCSAEEYGGHRIAQSRWPVDQRSEAVGQMWAAQSRAES